MRQSGVHLQSASLFWVLSGFEPEHEVKQQAKRARDKIIFCIENLLKISIK
jgi:hypothetical protein